MLIEMQERRNSVGKREAEHEGELRKDTHVPLQPSSCLDVLKSATAGSARVDLATAVEVTLQSTDVQVIPSTANRPLGYGLSALLIGRSSTSKQGIFVLPGLIDADYLGNIGIMVQTLTPPIHIPKGTRLAQLVPFKAKVKELPWLSKQPVEGLMVFTDDSQKASRAGLTGQDRGKWLSEILERPGDSLQVLELCAVIRVFEKWSNVPINIVSETLYVVEDAQEIVITCPQCQDMIGGLGPGVNPRGLGPLQLWQTYVTIYSSFGRFKCLHATIDTFSAMVWAIPMTSEGSHFVIQHWRGCFAIMALPQEIKTDNGSGYIAQRTQDFFSSLWSEA
ncbi:hypothetical protein TURU_008420 [Turdus rufiventris]|nr:hypothetical protein TURU_008420 [Turdus rufiventris]